MILLEIRRIIWIFSENLLLCKVLNDFELRRFRYLTKSRYVEWVLREFLRVLESFRESKGV